MSNDTSEVNDTNAWVKITNTPNIIILWRVLLMLYLNFIANAKVLKYPIVLCFINRFVMKMSAITIKRMKITNPRLPDHICKVVYTTPNSTMDKCTIPKNNAIAAMYVWNLSIPFVLKLVSINLIFIMMITLKHIQIKAKIPKILPILWINKSLLSSERGSGSSNQ